jgi:hypothetical protein
MHFSAFRMRFSIPPVQVFTQAGSGHDTDFMQKEENMSSISPMRLTIEELHAEAGAALPPKEVLSVPLLDLNLDVDLGLALAAPIDLAVAANLNAAIPINAAVSANVLSALSTSAAAAHQDVPIDQLISGEAIAHGTQDSTISQGDAAVGDDPVVVPPPPDSPDDVLAGGLLNVDAHVSLDADIAAPIAGAVAANANVAAPINAAVSANVGAIGSESVAVAEQTGTITQHLEDVTAEATVDQTSDIDQTG